MFIDMPASNDDRIWIGPSEQLLEHQPLYLNVIYAGELIPIFIFRHKGRCIAYRNLCVHMPRRLDCESNVIFDETGRFLRCFMHGIVYEPLTGASVSSICSGERLTPIEIEEDHAGIWITDRRVHIQP
jgi:nitrite reductase/ring-hydroxylating ferredoxin subunit